MDYRKDGNFFYEVKNLKRGRLFKLLVLLLLSTTISDGLVSSLFKIDTTLLLSGNLTPETINQAITTSNNFDILTFLLLIVTTLFAIAIDMEVLNSFRTKQFKMMNIFIHINNKPLEISIISIILALIYTIANHVPLVGWIASIMVSLAAIYVPYLLLDKKYDKVTNYITESYNLTMGHKMELFWIRFRYAAYSFLAFIITIIIVFFAMFQAVANQTTASIIAATILSLVVLLVWGIAAYYFLSLDSIACAYYYEKHMEHLNPIVEEVVETTATVVEEINTLTPVEEVIETSEEEINTQDSDTDNQSNSTQE